jgi:hypothetical protein
LVEFLSWKYGRIRLASFRPWQTGLEGLLMTKILTANSKSFDAFPHERRPPLELRLTRIPFLLVLIQPQLPRAGNINQSNNYFRIELFYPLRTITHYIAPYRCNEQLLITSKTRRRPHHHHCHNHLRPSWCLLPLHRGFFPASFLYGW